ncbi:FAD-dependent oxidoreductase [Paracoccus sp. PS-1]|uniref:FAD-dependent oxidoreductase n=1 Tax=unclassified Paracoccus (in: a-proteobacteria) TaxID=2688777 RepID=UPI00048A9A50|nr:MULTISPECIES: FAD-dependent oxidoreductase [unclassified Paracoccus (in: a-proteobacteria)]MDQ7263542.1 FAD-dependent oxidoreductase [Paracoccus sp. PS1]
MTVSQPYDFLVYRATPAGIVAAITAARLKLRTLLVEPSGRVGGMMTSGLNAADTLNSGLITGVPLEFFRAVRDEYAMPHLPVRIESSMALKVFRAMLARSGVELALHCDIGGIRREGPRLAECRLSDGRQVSSRWWVDASYEGDLMHLAGIRHRLGRESASEFGESLAGRQPFGPLLPWQPKAAIDPRQDGRPLPYVLPWSPPAEPGTGDDRLQSYCIRPTLTNRPENRLPVIAPEDFDFRNFALFRRLGLLIRAGRITSKAIPMQGTTFQSAYFKLNELPNGKFDMNSGPAAPLNNPALTQEWVKASMERRKALTQDFARYTQALLHFIQNDDSVPVRLRRFFGQFGLPADEYADSGHLPPEVYVREGRRLVGAHVFRQQDIEGGGVDPADAICIGKYHLDCKPVRWQVNRTGTNVLREGMFFSHSAHRYALPGWIILAHPDDCRNFFSVCGVSASHVAFSSIRMEPTWMELGAAAAMMAHLADRHGVPAHQIRGRSVVELRQARFRQWPSATFIRARLRRKIAGYRRKLPGQGKSAG